MDAQQGPPKRVRGPTRKQAIWDFELGERFTVTFEQGKPIGYEAKELTSFLGTVAKMSQHIDISITDWRKVSEDKKEDLWSIVKEKFKFAPVETEEIRLWVMMDIGRKWKQWKHELKMRYFDSSLTADEIVAAQIDSRVEKKDFKNLVTHWFREDAQAISEKRKTARSKSYEPHALGTKSFARLADEEKKKKGIRPTRGTLYIISRTKKDGSIVNETAAKVINEIKKEILKDASTSNTINDASTSTSNTANDASTSTSNTTTGNGIVDWTNDDLARVKGKKKGDYTRCVGPNIRFPRSKRSRVAQVPMLKARINELELEMKEMKDLKERQHIEMKEMKENQAAILQFMAKYKIHNSNEDFSNVLNTTNIKVANDSSSVHNPGPYGKSTSTRASVTKKSDASPLVSEKITHLSSAVVNVEVANDSFSVHNPGPYGKSTSTRASEIKKSEKAVTSPLASEKITHLNSAEMQLRKKFLEEDSELMKFHQQLVMRGFMSDNEFWCIRKVKQRVINCHQTLKTLNGDDALLLRKFGIQFKGDQKQVQLQLSEKSATTRSAF